jgi:hypothetical protein
MALTPKEEAIYFYSRERTKGFRDLGSNMSQTHSFAIPTTTIAAGVFEPFRDGPMTFTTAIQITTADTQQGLIFGYGDVTSSIAMWLENTATAVTSVEDSGTTPGVARFIFTPGPTLTVGQVVSNSTFTTTLYNAVGAITATGAGYFEIASIAWDVNDSGSFAFNSLGLQLGDNEGSPNNNSTVLSFDTTGLPDGTILEIGAMMNPGAEEARLWVNGLNVDRSDSIVGTYTGGVWSNNDVGSFADTPQIVYAGVPVASRIAPSGFAAVENLDAYSGQLPRQFDE